MLDTIFMSIEKLALSLIVGGGIVMAACARPLFLRVLNNRKDNPEIIATVEEISISAWNRYNRYAFLSAIIILLIDVIRVILGVDFSYWHLLVVALIFMMLLWKLAIDKQLKNRLQQQSASAVGSQDQNKGHGQVEMLSKFILLLSLFVTIWP